MNEAKFYKHTTTISKEDFINQLSDMSPKELVEDISKYEDDWFVEDVEIFRFKSISGLVWMYDCLYLIEMETNDKWVKVPVIITNINTSSGFCAWEYSLDYFEEGFEEEEQSEPFTLNQILERCAEGYRESLEEYLKTKI
jgi:hypothetical protein